VPISQKTVDSQSALLRSQRLALQADEVEALGLVGPTPMVTRSAS
jgi:hypothetical protein